MGKRIGLVAGVVGFSIFVILGRLLSLESITPSAMDVAAVTILMASWWMTEAIPIPATSLLPLVLFPMLGIASVSQTAAGYAHPLILFLMGGFFIALTVERWNLHRRLALGVVLRIGTRPDRLILGFMIAGALISMWISNTATTLMMLPIALAVLQRMEEQAPGDPRIRPIGVGLLLGLAYACNVGGMGTPLGTPPNLIFMANYDTVEGASPISFAGWCGRAMPIVLVMIPLIWLVLTRWVNRIDRTFVGGDRNIILAEVREMGRLNSAEWRVLIFFVMTALLWITRFFKEPVHVGSYAFHGWSHMLGLTEVHSTKGLIATVDDGTVAIGAAILMFLMPAGRDHKGEKLLDWDTAVRIPWGLLLLFGGGMALAVGFGQSGLSLWIGERLGSLAGLPLVVLTATVCLTVTFLTEVTSNTATTTVLMPVLASAAASHSIDPMYLMMPAALSASCAFMLPVATAPNAIVFGSGLVTMRDMVVCGIVINLIGVVVITALV